jgi:glycerol-3-phosphate acyltransferase PlsY
VTVSPAITLAAALGGYLLGSLPFGLILARLAGAGDIRRIGSGNIGATNVLRSGRKGAAALTLLLDAAKGWLAVWLALRLGGEAAAIAAALGAVLGHVFPPWLGFRGGKGVATLLGASLGLLPLAGLAFAAAWLAVAFVTRISSAGGMAGGFAAASAALAAGRPRVALALLALALFLLWTHRANIRRLIEGTEPRIGRGA